MKSTTRSGTDQLFTTATAAIDYETAGFVALTSDALGNDCYCPTTDCTLDGDGDGTTDCVDASQTECTITDSDLDGLADTCDSTNHYLLYSIKAIKNSSHDLTEHFALEIGDSPENPTLTAPDDQTADEDADSLDVTVSDIESFYSSAGGTLAVTTNPSDTSVVADPSVTYSTGDSTATLSFAPIVDASGDVTVTVTVTDDAGTVDDDTDDLTATDSFSISVTAVNDLSNAGLIGRYNIGLH